MALSATCHMCSANGLLVLFDRATRAICLLDPLIGALTNFPAFTRSNMVATVPLRSPAPSPTSPPSPDPKPDDECIRVDVCIEAVSSVKTCYNLLAIF
ncbi:hypothetical protein E2562_030824 [Oryza meyeriana var. granulata]|uniref:Uncharacterized protein n=1 Tax=Oryza meyeriana var. granulata TaxID=110450 RepID=A0A6G1E4Q0_9ORYZ|nr:hypothetical protein E2562_030824 [Oryza meyeriana var. granulata]